MQHATPPPPRPHPSPLTRSPSYLQRFHDAASWAYAHLVDRVGGEWWGYADRSGVVTHRFKGGAYKGCFHVPRALFMAEGLLQRALDKLRAQGAAA